MGANHSFLCDLGPRPRAAFEQSGLAASSIRCCEVEVE